MQRCVFSCSIKLGNVLRAICCEINYILQKIMANENSMSGYNNE